MHDYVPELVALGWRRNAQMRWTHKDRPSGRTVVKETDSYRTKKLAFLSRDFGYSLREVLALTGLMFKRKG